MNFVRGLKFLYTITVLCLRNNFTHNLCYYTFNNYSFEIIKNNIKFKFV